MSESPLYYLYHNEQQAGPYTVGQLRAMWQAGTVTVQTQYWFEGSDSWRPLSNLSAMLDPQPIVRRTEPADRERSEQPPIIFNQQIPIYTNAQEARGGAGLIFAGYLCSFLALVIFPPGLGLAGAAIGIVNLSRGRVGHGIVQIVLAVTCGFLGFAMGMANAFHSSQ